MEVRSFPERTEKRMRDLNAYFEQEVMAEAFVCKSELECKASAACSGLAFYEGQLHHVGNHYDLEVDRKAMRVLLVGQEYGHKPSLVSLEDRREMILDTASEGWSGRDPFMKGITTLLRLLHRLPPGTDQNGEQISIGSATIHLFEAFALVDYLLCSAVLPNTKRGNAPYQMRRNCARHFKKAVEILDPTLMILLGYGVRGSIKEAYGAVWVDRTCNEFLSLDGRQTRALTFSHPSWQGRPWGRSIKSQYLEETVTPAIAGYLGL